MPPLETTRRFNRLFLALLRALAMSRRPLVLLLDDLQWAGPASMRLLNVLLVRARWKRAGWCACAGVSGDTPRCLLALVIVSQADASLSHIMVVLSYRDNEVADDHPLRHALVSFASSTAAVHWKHAEVELQPLGVGAVSSLVAFQLWDEYPDGMDALVAEILERTQGIPFLALQVRLRVRRACERRPAAMC